MKVNLQNVMTRMMTGDGRLSLEERSFIQTKAYEYVNKGSIPKKELVTALAIISISNLLYNNAPNALLPLDDNTYDALISVCKSNNIQYPVGAPSIQFNQYTQIAGANTAKLEKHDGAPIEVMRFVPHMDSRLFYPNMVTNLTPPRQEDFLIQSMNEGMIERKMRNTSHQYDMCGTLEKCKYVLMADAEKDGITPYTNTVQVFERDYLRKHQMANLLPQRIQMVASLKYDGVSVEAVIRGDTLISACTRGDTGNNEASDLTPALGGMKFPRATGVVDSTEEFGIKFEFIITKYNLLRLAQEHGKEYANARNAVIGILGGLDARKFRDYLTPVPLETSLDIPRLTELEFLNKYYTKGIDMRHALLDGAYVDILFQIRKFAQEAESLRSYMDFMYDGIVVEYIDPWLRQTLGKKGSIPEYAVAIKFPPMKNYATFTHYTFSVGQSGRVVPMAHFTPVEFMGAIHDKTTVHSFRRFKDLALRPGDKVLLTLSNDVIVYLTKAPESEQPANNPNPVEQFPEFCPSCGQTLRVSESGDSAFCTNFYCQERVIARLAGFLSRLNIKDFSTETIRRLGIVNLYQLFTYPQEQLEKILGPIEAQNFLNRINELKTHEYADYRILGAIGFTGIATETWKKILHCITFNDVITLSPKDFKKLVDSYPKMVGPKTRETLLREREIFHPDLITISRMMRVTSDKLYPLRVEVRFSGFRDNALTEAFNRTGIFHASEDAVTGNTKVLVIPYQGYSSTKVERMKKNIAKFMPTTTNPPIIVTKDEAWALLAQHGFPRTT